jgi:hypothetical protein
MQPDDIRITISASDEPGAAAAASEFLSRFVLVPDRQTAIERASSGRWAKTFSFSRDILNVPAAPLHVPRAEAARTEAVRKALTEEQGAVVAQSMKLSGGGITVNAYAGSGKTTVLRECALANPTKRFLYLAFNKSIAKEAGTSFPANVTVSTAHSLALRSIVMGERTGVGGRIDVRVMSASIGIPERVGNIQGRRVCYFVLETIEAFCRSADMEIAGAHLPNRAEISLGQMGGRVLAYAKAAWAAIAEGKLPLTHSAYLKTWQVSLRSGDAKGIGYDYVLFDEAQDANPVIADIVRHIGCPVVRVGDSFQQIYAWNGAVDALDEGKGPRFYLTWSFRFGPEIAAVAGNVLKMHPSLKAKKAPPLVGKGRPGVVEVGAEGGDAVLCRSNGGLLEEAISACGAGIPFAIVGGIDEVRQLVADAVELHRGKRPARPPFSAFDDWIEAKEAVEAGMAQDVSFIVKLIDQKGPEKVLADMRTIERTIVEERYARLTISTIHKAKGREWSVVRLSSDILPVEAIREKLTQARSPAERRQIAEEVNLVYVACTRAKDRLILPMGLAVLKGSSFAFDV